jgi:flagellar biosynthesis/type III secretory pathway protein FliH
MLYERNWTKQQVLDLFAVIDWMMRVPQPLQRQLLEEIRELERERAMPYMNPFQKLGLEEGLQQGRQEGRKEGRQAALCNMLEIQLEHRFGQLPQGVRERLRRAGPDDLQAWGIAVLSAANLNEVFSSR